MSDLVEKVARAIAEAFPSAGRGPSALRTQPIDIEAANDLARAAIAVCADEMRRAIRSAIAEIPEDQRGNFDILDDAIAAAIRSMGERG